MVKPREKRVPIMMSEEEMTSIDDWRFANRVATRSDAIRRLCQIGLKTSEVTDVLRDGGTELSDLLSQAFKDAFPDDDEASPDTTEALRHLVAIEEVASKILIALGGVLDAATAMHAFESAEQAIKHFKEIKQQYAEFLEDDEEKKKD